MGSKHVCSSEHEPDLATLTDFRWSISGRSTAGDGIDQHGAEDITSSSELLSARRPFDSGPWRVTDFISPGIGARSCRLERPA